MKNFKIINQYQLEKEEEIYEQILKSCTALFVTTVCIHIYIHIYIYINSSILIVCQLKNANLKQEPFT